MDRIHVLYIEDNPDHIELLQHHLGKSKWLDIDMVAKDNMSKGLECLAQGTFDVVISDLSLPDSSPKETVSILSEKTDLPIVVLTSLEDTSVIVRMIKDGASDCLSKENLFKSSAIEKAIFFAKERHHINTNLLEAKQKAEKASLAKTRFLSHMSHEIRTPINAILGFTDLLGLEVQKTEHIEMIKDIKTSGEILLGLIDDILNLQKIEDDSVELNPAPTMIEKAMEDVLSSLRAYAAEFSVTCIGAYEGLAEPWPVDAARLKQIVINLISNAIKYNQKHGEVRVSVKANDEHLTISVQDQGKGIPKDKLERLFVPFDRLGLENHDIQGTGIGLNIAHQLTQLMGGTLSVESEVGVGSVFSLVLPKAGESHLDEKKADCCEVTSLLQHKVQYRSELLVFYVEDNLISQKLVKKLLGRYGIPVKIFGSAEEALPCVEIMQPKVILMDINLPEMSGIEASRLLRPKKQALDFIIMALSADVMPDQTKQALDAGVDEYLTKPLDRRVLMNHLQACCKEVLQPVD